MKKLLFLTLLFSLMIFTAFAGGKAEEEPVAETSEPVDMTALYIKLNRAGFDTPSEALPSIDFELPNLQGVSEKLSDYKGQVVFLNFWATWCGPCRSEMPAMEAVYNELKDDGFVILAVDLGEDRETVQKFVDEFGLTFPVLLDETGSTGGQYDARSIPTTYMVDREGNILGRAIGARPWEEESYMELFKEILEL